MNQVIIHIILVALVLGFFVMATADKVNGRGVKQQVLEKQIALLVDSALPGMEFIVWKKNINGVVQNVELDDGKVYVKVEGLRSVKGYPYFTKYSVGVVEEEDKFIVEVW